MPVCDGRGDNGDHCCYINGQVCQFLEMVNGQPRCPFYSLGKGIMDLPEWQAAPVGKWFMARYPGFSCLDWPQNIPEVMELGVGLCCWAPEVTV